MKASPRLGRGIALALATRVGAVLVGFWVAMLAEYLAVANLHAHLLTGAWETAAMRNYVMPVACGILVPTALALTLLGTLAARTPQDSVARRLLASATLLAAAAVAWGVSSGRRMASPPIRIGFVLVVSLFAGAIVFALAPRLVNVSRRKLAAGGALVALGAWLADVYVLPRLYPAFHSALFFLLLAGAAVGALALPLDRRWARGVALGALAVSLLGLVFSRPAANRLAGYDNLRLVIVDRAPMLGRAVRLAASLAPPPDDAPPGASTVTGGATDAAPALDWRNRDVLLVSIDALRADHVGAYGYPAPTTPHLDALAKRGVVFDAAYSPTPHTSYAVTSMMTGKYMRPLLSLGLGNDSDSWAGILRHYGYRTAAFYPPAVFFIDEALFAGFRDRGLDFEYRKVEFADAALRVRQIEDYVSRAPADQPLFVWAHFFEPHEPYVVHPDHVFGDRDAPKPIDAYDSEIAASDAALGALVQAFEKRRPNAVVIVTADHGEEFGEHGGRYHGTSVYDEQVHVPLVIAGGGIAAGRVAGPVQTIDLLPTLLSALRVPRPARVRGRDLGRFIATPSRDEGFAFSETEDHTMVAEGRFRLVCERRIGACALYDVTRDPKQTRDVTRESPEVAARLRKRAAELARSHGRLEMGTTAGYPESLRRALQGDSEAAIDVAPLLDDVRVDLRRGAARALFELAVPETQPFAERALASEQDQEVKEWTALALVRLGVAREGSLARGIAEQLLVKGDADARFRAALAFAAAGDARGVPVLADRLEASHAKGAAKKDELSFADERATIDVLAKLRDKRAVRALLGVLPDVRLRPRVAEALGAIGDPSARGPLLKALSEERYVTMRGPEARALVALGARGELEPALRRFAGVPEPWPDALRIAESAGVLKPMRGHAIAAAAEPRRLYLRPRADGRVTVTVRTPKGELAPALIDDDVRVFEIDGGASAEIEGDLAAAWLVGHADEIPPPPPVPWDAGADATP